MGFFTKKQKDANNYKTITKAEFDEGYKKDFDDYSKKIISITKKIINKPLYKNIKKGVHPTTSNISVIKSGYLEYMKKNHPYICKDVLEFNIFDIGYDNPRDDHTDLNSFFNELDSECKKLLHGTDFHFEYAGDWDGGTWILLIPFYSEEL